MTEKSNIEKLKDLVEGQKAAPPQLEHLNKKQEVHTKGKWGGKREGAGGVKPTTEETIIKRGIKQWIDDHVKENVKVTVVDRKTGKTTEIEKTRLMYALEVLYQLGTGATSKGNAGAMNMWLDRALGKPPQTLRGGDEDDAPLRVDIGFDVMLDKVYDDK